ncbi:MAG: ABC transporter permease [Phycisphaeraceae bacterium]|nr:ABC transporter permease [Phycisphaeraceae bacterium]
MTFLWETIHLGLTNLWLHKLRSLLTIISIIFGVAAVIVMVAIGEGNKRKALAEIQSLGAENILVRSTKPPESAQMNSSNRNFVISYGLKREDLDRIRQTVAPIREVIPLKRVSARVTCGAQQSPASVFGVTPRLQGVASQSVARGRFLTDLDEQIGGNVAVIGAEIADRIFPLFDPLGNEIRIEQVSFRVVGVLNRVGQSSSSSSSASEQPGASSAGAAQGRGSSGSTGGSGSSMVGRDLDLDVYIPLSTASSRFGDLSVRRTSGSTEAEQVEITELIVHVQGRENVPSVADQLRRALNYTKNRDDIRMIVPLELLQQAERTQKNFNYLLLAIASIGLWISGIGIMNIMLASVTERTREIGIRRAVGARRLHIIAQFLVETTVLSGVGGLLGVLLGLSVVPVLLAARMTFPDFFRDQGDPEIATWSIVASFLAATIVGVVFGLYPAYKASQQDPIEALRHD